MITVGLTGGIASGKSAISKTFMKHGIPIVDADLVAREVVTIGSAGWEMIRDIFGKDHLNDDETINRAKLGDLVFGDVHAMYDLNAIMKPLIEMESEKQIKDLHDRGHSIVVYDAALIIEQGNADKYRPLIVVACPKEMQVERIMKRNNVTEAQALARINAQLSVEEKTAVADYVVDTSGTLESSINQTEDIIKKLKV
jgi:dephospho-CoA kinase